MGVVFVALVMHPISPCQRLLLFFPAIKEKKKHKEKDKDIQLESPFSIKNSKELMN